MAECRGLAPHSRSRTSCLADRPSSLAWLTFLLNSFFESELADGVGFAPTQPKGSFGFRDRGITTLPTIPVTDRGDKLSTCPLTVCFQPDRHRNHKKTLLTSSKQGAENQYSSNTTCLPPMVQSDSCFHWGNSLDGPPSGLSPGTRQSFAADPISVCSYGCP